MEIKPLRRTLTWTVLIATVIIIAGVLSPIASTAATYYVATNGSNTNSGSDTRPFQTITFAYSLANPGDTIIVKPGVYTEQDTIRGIYLHKSGTASNPIVLKSEVKWQAVLDGENKTGDVRRGIIWLNGDYNVIDGFEMKNGKMGLIIYGDGNEIKNNHIHNNGNIDDPNSSSGYSGVYTNQFTQNNVFSGNYIHHNGRLGSGLSDAGHGLYLCGDNELVVNNIVTSNAGYGLQIAGYETVSNMKVYHNVFAWNEKSGIVLWKVVDGIDIINNILYKNKLGISNTAASGAGVRFDSNIFYENLSGTISLSGASYSYTLGTSITADPSFISDRTDFHIQTNSSAIDAGIKLADVTSDFDGNPRDQEGLYDIGAYEFQGEDQRFNPPTNLRVVAQ